MREADGRSGLAFIEEKLESEWHDSDQFQWDLLTVFETGSRSEGYFNLALIKVMFKGYEISCSKAEITPYIT